MPKFSPDDTVLVTGASSGLGLKTALLLNSLGASVVAVGRDEGRLDAMRSQAAFPERVFCEARDLAADPDGIPEWTASMAKKFGKFSGLAGFAGEIDILPASMIDAESMRRIFEVNFFSAVMLARSAASGRVRGRRLSIVMASSAASLYGEPALLSYAASKAALNSAVRTLAAEFGRLGVRANAVLPGNISKMRSAGTAEIDGGYIPRLPEPADKAGCVANLAAFLLSEDSYWITGQCIVIDGGETL